MKKIFIILLIVLIIAFIFVFFILNLDWKFNKIINQKIYSCETDTDCVKATEECNCVAINKNYLEKWEQNEKFICLLDYVPNECIKIPKCLNNKCLLQIDNIN